MCGFHPLAVGNGFVQGTACPSAGCEPRPGAPGSDGTCAARVEDQLGWIPQHACSRAASEGSGFGLSYGPILNPKWDTSWLLNPGLVISSLLAFSSPLSSLRSCALTCGPAARSPAPWEGSQTTCRSGSPASVRAPPDVLWGAISSSTPVHLTLSKPENSNSCSVSGVVPSF